MQADQASKRTENMFAAVTAKEQRFDYSESEGG